MTDCRNWFTAFKKVAYKIESSFEGYWMLSQKNHTIRKDMELRPVLQKWNYKARKSFIESIAIFK